MRKVFSSQTYIVLPIIFFGSFLRFFNPLWDAGLFLHPDERLFINASDLSLPTSFAQFLSPNSPLNPHMFYYGSLLLYLYKLASLISPFSLLMTSRLISALFSSLTITFIFLIAKKLFSLRVGIISAVIFACCVGSIQYAHFNTTESLLTLLISAITFIDIQSVKTRSPQLLILSLFFVSIAAATKVTGLLYGVSPLLAMTLLIGKEKLPIKQVMIYFIVGIFISVAIFILLTPYQIIDLKTFLVQQSYMQGVTYGTFKPPFVLIYQHTLPYIYQLFHVFPFYLGFLSFPLSLIGLFSLLRILLKKQKKYLLFLFLFTFPLLYFTWSGSWFAKFGRYYILLLPFMTIWAGFAVSKLNKFFQIVCLLFIICNALFFMKIYLSENTRVTASKWIYSHLPQKSVIATEHWDDALPLTLPRYQSTFRDKTLLVYDTESTKKISDLAQTIATTDYIIFSSRRVYESILENTTIYPLTGMFYKKLFSGRLGYSKVYDGSNYPFILSDNFADETFQSYDHPPVVVFQNKKRFSQVQIFSLLTSQ